MTQVEQVLREMRERLYAVLYCGKCKRRFETVVGRFECPCCGERRTTRVA